MNNKIEIACFNYESAIIANKMNADRIEICDNMKEGGTSPSFELVEKLSKEISCEIMVMIRPRGGSFVYSESEFNQMKQEITKFKSLNIKGFVFGCLNQDNSININQNKELISLAFPFDCTFHRAFDLVYPLEDSLEQVINLGFKTILTSGKESNVNLGLDNLNKLVQLANNRISIMPGGGVRSNNISKLKLINTNYFHSSGITNNTEITNPEEIKSLINNAN